MVLGTPMTESTTPRAAASSAISWAPRSVPSPPMTNRTDTPSRASVVTSSAESWGPRELPRIVPPRLGLRAAQRPPDGPAAVVDAGHQVRGQRHRIGLPAQAMVAVAEADDIGHAVAL